MLARDQDRPKVLTIAGFDPSGGAGVLADVKTFETLKVYGLAAITSNTIQDDSNFIGLQWIPEETLFRQVETLFAKYTINHAKIGLIRNFKFLAETVGFLKKLNPGIRIIWDPILKSSSGFTINAGKEPFPEAVLQQLALITPNWHEANSLWNNDLKRIESLGKTCPVYLKGGHHPEKPGTDILFSGNDGIREFSGAPFGGSSKHGTGCVFSAAATAYLALGMQLSEACLRAKRYTEKYILSNESNLGYHAQDL